MQIIEPPPPTNRLAICARKPAFDEYIAARAVRERTMESPFCLAGECNAPKNARSSWRKPSGLSRAPL